MFPILPQNSVVAHNGLFKWLNCTTLVSPLPRPPSISTILATYPLDALDAPSVDKPLSNRYPHFNFSKTYLEAAREILAVLHISSSTGILTDWNVGGCKIRLVNQYVIPLKDWRYIDFCPRAGVELRKIAWEEHETVIARSLERKRYQFPFTTKST
ncbi:hypothetical protein BDV26DRAFT_291888 [Aspergillus bertholletiae]|uniref:Uncharacterized protein n=1 Tax=Aspergillus bertholletiae TaxID=1226010 RepID=A0A5N7BAJ8_9EURO|nr:hypothetical protein BDV26DRAFT_291888 [Aspergillus bertholletiae]